jgi:hypothetical protein
VKVPSFPLAFRFELHARLVAIDELDASGLKGALHGLNCVRVVTSPASFEASHGRESHPCGFRKLHLCPIKQPSGGSAKKAARRLQRAAGEIYGYALMRPLGGGFPVGEVKFLEQRLVDLDRRAELGDNEAYALAASIRRTLNRLSEFVTAGLNERMRYTQ